MGILQLTCEQCAFGQIPLTVAHGMNIGPVRRWLRKLYWNCAEFKDTTNFAHIKTAYYSSTKDLVWTFESFSMKVSRDAVLSTGKPYQDSSSWTDTRHVAFELNMCLLAYVMKFLKTLQLMECTRI